MVDNSDRARKERAARLREKIENLSKATTKEPTADKGPQPESAADFVHRKMREIDKKRS